MLPYAARVRYNNACLLVYSLRFSTKYRLVLCNIRPIAVIRRRIVSNTVAIQVIVFFSGRGREVPMEIVVEV